MRKMLGATIGDWQKEVHHNAIDKGFWDKGQERSIPTLLCLIHSEVSEALEVYRGGHDGTLGEELADVVIRVMDMAAGYGIDLEEEIYQKHQRNLTRPRLHGKKL